MITPATRDALTWIDNLAANPYAGEPHVHARALKGYDEQRATGWRAMQAERDAAHAREERLKAAVGALVDRIDPDDPGALLEFLHALDGLLGGHRSAPPVVAAVRLGQAPSPRPREAS